jgi:hypothetical protein
LKVIFLDIDGVLNNRESVHKRHEEKLGNVWLPDITLVERLKQIIDATGAQIVVSSTWRLHGDSFMFRHLFAALGFNLPFVIGKSTPRLHKRRGIEIQQWLDEHNAEYDADPEFSKEHYHERADSFIILDDDSDMEHLMDRLVQTKTDLGLQDEHVEQAIKLLNTPAG